jgi:adenylate kinase family enzyme
MVNSRISQSRRAGRLAFILCLTWIAHAQAAAPLIIFVGPPGAGKTTQATILQKDRGMALISVDQLIEQNQQVFEKFRHPEIHGIEPHSDPALNKLVEEKLRSTDLAKGVILDGYPASKEQGDYLANLIQELHLPKPMIIRLRAPDDVVRKRLQEENAEDVGQRLKDYHRELDFAPLYFPQADIHDIDATKPPATVTKEIQKVLPK